MTYRYLPHTADIRVALASPTLEGLLQDALAVSRQLFVGESVVEAREWHQLAVDAKDAEDLVLSFLQELLYRYTTDGFVPTKLTVNRVAPVVLRAEVGGEQLDPARHVTEPEVKSVTRHGFSVQETDEGWHAEVLFDV